MDSAVGVVLCVGIAVAMMIPVLIMVTQWCPIGCETTYDPHAPWYDGTQKTGPVRVHMPDTPTGHTWVCNEIVYGVAMHCTLYVSTNA